MFNQKYFEGRELNAIIDFLVSKQCNNLFIGNFNINESRGSTFSYYITKIINKNINIGEKKFKLSKRIRIYIILKIYYIINTINIIEIKLKVNKKEVQKK